MTQEMLIFIFVVVEAVQLFVTVRDKQQIRKLNHLLTPKLEVTTRCN